MLLWQLDNVVVNYTTVVMGTIVFLELTSDSMPHAHASYNTLSVLFAGRYEIWSNFTKYDNTCIHHLYEITSVYIHKYLH